MVSTSLHVEPQGPSSRIPMEDTKNIDLKFQNV